MKKFVIAAAALAASSVLSPVIAGGPPLKLNISLDGLCDVFHLQESASGIYGTHSGCAKKENSVGVIFQDSGTTWITSSISEPHDKNAYVIYFSPPNHGAGGWIIYGTNGKSYAPVNNGTYSKLSRDGKAAKPGEHSAVYGRN